MAKKPSKKTQSKIKDEGESVALMEPMLISHDANRRAELNDLVVDLVARSSGFKRSLPEGTITALSDLVRSMNCYYSNLIEGHSTHPIAIERAMRKNYDQDPKRRNLQIEAEAHVAVQRWIDQGELAGRTATLQGLRDVHRKFCAALPEDLLWIENRSTGERVRVEPGEWRKSHVKVGLHEAISPGAIERFMRRFESTYTGLGRAQAILSSAAAHHRLLWIYPFLDGNGRVTRLMSHAMMLETLDTGSIWSVARGLARNVAAYKGHLAACDLRRRNDLDGRGHLSEEALTSFTAFFLKICIDQVDFMERLMQPEQLRSRIISWAENESRIGGLPTKAGQISRGRSLPRRASARRHSQAASGHGPAGTANCERAARSQRTDVAVVQVSVAPRLSCHVGPSLDARIISTGGSRLSDHPPHPTSAISPLSSAVGEGGQPRMWRSTGTTAETPPTTP